MNFANFQRIVRDCQAERNDYPRNRDWLLRLYDRLLNRWPGATLPFRKKVCSIYKKGHAQPFFVRLGSSDWQVLNEIFVKDEYAALLACDLGKPQWIVDLGSNIGLSLRLWRQHFPEAHLIAVEPDADNVRILQLNLQDSPRGQVIVEQACVLGHTRPVQLHQAGGEWGYSVKELDGKSFTTSGNLSAFTMPELLGKHCPEAEIGLLKCDIEGSEAELFRNCASWLRKVRFAVVELHGPYRVKDFERDVAESGIPIEIVSLEEGTDLSLVIFRTLPIP